MKKKVSEILHLPQGQRPVTIIPIGHEDEKPKEKITRGTKDLLHTLD